MVHFWELWKWLLIIDNCIIAKTEYLIIVLFSEMDYHAKMYVFAEDSVFEVRRQGGYVDLWILNPLM